MAAHNPVPRVTNESGGDAAGALVLRLGFELAGRLDYRTTATEIVIDYVEVSPRRRGQGLGVHLVDAAAAWARETGRTLVPICGYAARVLRSDSNYCDVLQHRNT